MSEQEWISRAKKGDLEAFDELMKGYYPQVERFAFQMGNPPDAVEDITQEVFIRVYRYLNRYSRGKFSTWLYKITLNVSKDMYRKRKSLLNKVNLLKHEYDGIESSAEEDLLRSESDRELHRLIQQLNDKYKIPVILFYFEEMRHDEISEILDIPVNTVKTRLLRGREQLRNALGKGEALHAKRSF
ncbi:MAG TPA: sigma-70 family RNA polymerase sigma factor [Bacillales bacterium]|nr:sigma-70 family RNA polymerase sigma factor [Bacillales bacterium]